MTSKDARSTTRAVGAAPKRAAAHGPGAGLAKSVQKATPRASETPPRSADTPGGASGATTPKAKLVRDSFTIPKSEYAVLESLKVRAADLTRPAKKSELLRAGIVALKAMSDAAFLSALSRVPSLKTGRPKGLPNSKASGKSTR